MTNESQTIEKLQAQVEAMSRSLIAQGLIPHEVKKRRPLTAEERQAREETLDSVEGAWRTETARIQGAIDKAQAAYDAARMKMNAANEDAQRLRVELTRATEEMVEKRDAIRRELL